MPDSENDGLLSQDDIDAALAAAGAGPESASAPAEASASAAEEVLPAAAGGEPPPSDERKDSSGRPFDEFAAAMADAIQAEKLIGSSPGSPDATPFEIPELGSENGRPAPAQSIDLLRDVELNVKIELGRSRMLVEDVLRLGEGSVVELDKLAGDPVDVLVNNRLVARGEVLVLNDNFCVRISDILTRNPGVDWQE